MPILINMTKRIQNINYQPLMSKEEQIALHFERLANDSVAINGCLYPISRSTEGYEGQQIEYCDGKMIRLICFNGKDLIFTDKDNIEYISTPPSFEELTIAQWETIVEENPVILDSGFICFWDVFCSFGVLTIKN